MRPESAHLCAAGSSMRLASCDSWLLLLVSTMLGRRCSSLREGGGGVWEALVEQDLGTRAVGGQLSSPASSADEFEQGTTEMEMERPWPPPPACRGAPLVKLGKGTVGEKTSPSCWVSGRRSSTSTSPGGSISKLRHSADPCEPVLRNKRVQRMNDCHFTPLNLYFLIVTKTCSQLYKVKFC